MRSNIKFWVWLSSLIKLSPLKRIKLLDYYKDPAFLWEASEAELKAAGLLTPAQISNILNKEARKAADLLLESAFQCDADIITLCDKAYPGTLKNIPDPPVVLYTRGKLEQNPVCVAIVGSRRATPYGLDMARRLSRELAINGVTVVSGMARGIDSRAHSGAIEAGGKTVAVLGCGVDIVYPPENRELMTTIIAHGAVVSEYVPGTQPIPYNFPARNRIISGLSQGVLIVEAGEKSGSLITTDFALEQGREVFAVPGNINSLNSAGTNRLIGDGAKLVTNAADILEELKVGHSGCESPITNKKPAGVKPGGVDACLEDTGMKDGAAEKTIAQRLLNGPAHIDVIARDCGISPQLAASVLTMLELSGFVEQLPGKFFKLAE